MRFDFRIINVTGDYWESIFEDYESIIWTVNHNDVGECEIKAPATEANLNLLKMNRLVMNMNKAKVTVPGYNVNNPRAAYTTQRVNEGCVITSVEIDDATHTITAKGKSLEYLLTYRVDDNIRNFTGSSTTEYSKLISSVIADFDGQFGQPPIFRDGLLMEYSADKYRSLVSPSNVTLEASWNDYLELAQKLMSLTDEYGFRLFMLPPQDESGERGVCFEVIALRNGKATFSDELDNLSGFKISKSCEGYNDGALVLGDGEGSNRIYEWFPRIPEQTGINVRYVAIDARDMQSADYSSTSDYRFALQFRGRDKKVPPVTTYEFEVDATTQFRYREDFYIGDSVNIVSRKYGVSLTAQVAQAVETYSADGYKVAISVGNVRENLAKRLNKRYGR